jgi:hypothetical protein
MITSIVISDRLTEQFYNYKLTNVTMERGYSVKIIVLNRI